MTVSIKKCIAMLLFSSLLCCFTADAETGSDFMQYLIDETQGNVPFRLPPDQNDFQLNGSSNSQFLILVSKTVRPENPWALYIIDFDEKTYARIQRICSLYRNTNELNDHCSKMQTEVEEEFRKAKAEAASSPRDTTIRKMTELQKKLTKVQDMLSRSRGKREMADDLKTELFRELESPEKNISAPTKKPDPERGSSSDHAPSPPPTCSRMKHLEVYSPETMVFFSGKKIFFAIEVTDREKYVNTWHQVFDFTQNWILK